MQCNEFLVKLHKKISHFFKTRTSLHIITEVHKIG